MPQSLSWFAVALTTVCLACTSAEPPSSEPSLAPAAPRTASSWLAAPAWSPAPPMRRTRSLHTTTLLPSGKLLVAGGRDEFGSPLGADVYDPATGTWSQTGPMRQQRLNHSATLLPSGKVLVAGGGSSPASAELFDPATNTWSATGSMVQRRAVHTATLLPSGKVLVAGGIDIDLLGYLTSCELYDPVTGTWSTTGSLPVARYWHSTTLLASGKVLVAGGTASSGAALNRVDLYDPATGTWSQTGSMVTPRFDHITVLLHSGQVLAAGGRNLSPSTNIASAELYNPATGTWSATGSMAETRYLFEATLLTSGQVLVTGGNQTTTLGTAELFNPATGTWSAAPIMPTPRYQHTSTLLPDGRVFLAGGRNDPFNLASVDMYDPGAGAWSTAGFMSKARFRHTGTLLPSGKVLVVGGNDGTSPSQASADLYDPVNNSWASTGSLSQPRSFHTATLLQSGKVLVAGGLYPSGPQPNAELYDPATGSWSSAGALAEPRSSGHTSTLLPSGNVLVTGGWRSTTLDHVELYDPATNSWSSAPSVSHARGYHTATVLPSGKVLVTGGEDDTGPLSSAELYDPFTRTWSTTGSMAQARARHTATLLPSGKVLVTGGHQASSLALASAELYDPATGTWSTTGSMAALRREHAAVLMPSGKVLVVSGGNTSGRVTSTEEYDPATGTWKIVGTMATGRVSPTATLLPTGKVLITGGQGDLGPRDTAEVYDPLVATPAWKPTIAGLTPGSPWAPGNAVTVTGARFRGLSESGSGAPRASNTDVPLLSLLDVQQERLITFPFQNFSATQVTATVPAVPSGHYLLTLTTNALSAHQLVQVIDLTEPDTLLTSTPSNPSNQAIATFSFTATEAGVAFECGLDGAAFSDCTSPASYADLADGVHTFQVRARDGAGNVDASPASYSWTLDVTVPDTALTSTPPTASNQTTASFSFTATEAGAAFECKLDAAAFTPCPSPASYASLTAGTHTFQVRARDAAGNIDASPASYSWTVDLTVPNTTLTSTPPSRTNQNSFTFTFTATEAGATFECGLDGATFSDCTSPASYTNLTEGAHTFQVRARDAAGNVDATPASASWTVDLTPPDTALTGTPFNPTNQPTATFVLYSTEGGSTFECRMDAAAFAACISPVSYANLSHGPHTFQVRARDAAGNVDATPATASWTVDRTVPDTVLTSTPPNPSNQFTSTFTFTSPEPGVTFECKLGSLSYTACTSPATYSVGVGTATFQVRARDAAGNIDATPASYTWTIDVTAPDSTLTSTPTDPTRQTTATFTFTATEAGSTFECRLDGAAFSACTSPISYSDLAGGSHTFRVRARDIAGNVETSPASHFWFIDLVPPNTSLSSTPYNPTNQPTATFVLSATETGGIYECSLDGAPFSVCTSPVTYPNLADGVHTFQARAYDSVGNMDPTPASYTWTLDATVPDTFISSPPPSPSNQNSVSIPFGSPEAGASFECKLDGWSFTLCVSPSRHTNLAEGSHTLQVRARDAAGNIDPTPASTTWVVDLTAPDTRLDSAPPNASNENTATFTFSSEAGATFECRLDGAAFSSCTSPINVTNLAEGSHTFEVRAWDAAGNVDATPASSSWTVDLTVPDTLLTSYPPDPTNQLSATFGFSSTEAGALFECKLDAGAFTSCTSPASYASLATGVHSFQVRARDAAGNVDPTPFTYNWTIDVLEPNTTITLKPADPTRQTSAIFGFTSTEARSTFECSLDAEDFSPCSSPSSYANIAEGTHTFRVRARDVAGNADSSPASYTWFIDLTPPNTSISSAPPNPSNQSSATFIFSTTETGGGYECSLDGATFTPCTSPTRYTNLSDGPHTFQVRAYDAVGNVDPTPESYLWTLDATVPDTVLLSTPPSPSNQNSVSIAFSASEAGVSFECKLDAGDFNLCVSPSQYADLAEGSHTFQVRARDTAGNIDATPASTTWVIDLTAPDTRLDSAPSNPSNQPSATFNFASEAGAVFECRLDEAAFSSCASPVSATNLTEGSHTFQVRARDAAGNVDASPATYSWTVDLTEPDTVITSTPANPSNQSFATFTFSATDPGATLECRLDGAAFSPCSSPSSYSNLPEGSHTFQVRARDAAGNVDPTPASFSWTLDVTGPDTVITSTPPNPSNQPTATFTFSATEAGATFDCSLDGGLFSACTSPIRYDNLAEGSHSFYVRARDAAGNLDPTSAFYSWSLDRTEPDTLLLSTPANLSNQSSATFTFSATETGATFECNLDGGPFSACFPPVNLANLSEGSHLFQVRARDTAGNVDPSPASYTWGIDLTAPDTILLSTPANPSNQSFATFTFSATEAGITFECNLDGMALGACASPLTLSNLPEGSHTFQVRARDAAGNVDPSPASFSWTLDVTGPNTVITSTPANPSNQPTTTFTFSATEAGATFDCSLDGGLFSACTSPIRYDNLAEGSHSFYVRARDAAGNVDASPAAYSWTVDLTAPDTLLTSTPANPSNQPSATFTFSATETGATFECSLDGGPFSACSPPFSYNNLSAGSHLLRVRARDTAGNVDPSPVSYTWVVDLAAPDTLLISTPPNPSNQTTATFTFSATEAGITFECHLDGMALGACASPRTFSNLPEGSHIFQVQARDAAGNVDPTPTSYSWTVDLTVPNTLLISTPANPSNQPSATFAFSATEAGATFDCSLDGGLFSACASPIRYDNLAEGSHSFYVRARDAAGNVAASPVAYSWTVDLTAPDTLLTSIPPSPTNQPTATFTFSAMETAVTFECSLDAGLFSACTSPFSYNNLSAGSHLFQVRARDMAGNVDPSPASASWTLELTAPDTLLTSTPLNPTAQSSASFTFSATEEGVTFECSLDGTAFSACSSPVSLANLSEGPHTFQVRARDMASNVDPSPASFSWLIDLTAPDTLLTSTPPNPSNEATVTVTFASEDTATFECRLDGADFTACTSPVSLANLPEGAHTFQVRARDAAGNVDQTPATYSWLIDRMEPDTLLTSTPSNPSNQSSATFTFSGTEAEAAFECSLDGAGFSACTSPASLANLSEGAHTFRVRARDAAGNLDPTPASFSWVIDLSVPSAPVITAPADGALLSDPQPVISGTAQPGSLISLTLDGTVLGITTADEAGNWAFTLEQPLADGEHLVTATSSDTGGTSSASTPVRFTVDTTPDTPEPPDPGGCDCAAGSGDASWLLGGLALLARLTSRRRRPLR